ncbi:hypothetical protein L600_001300000630 [Isoptericola variabilis J7]|nr:hypothetical protein L600_001300000630 [Isoptericola variabilis J7]
MQVAVLQRRPDRTRTVCSDAPGTSRRTAPAPSASMPTARSHDSGEADRAASSSDPEDGNAQASRSSTARWSSAVSWRKR